MSLSNGHSVVETAETIAENYINEAFKQSISQKLSELDSDLKANTSNGNVEEDEKHEQNTSEEKNNSFVSVVSESSSDELEKEYEKVGEKSLIDEEALLNSHSNGHKEHEEDEEDENFQVHKPYLDDLTELPNENDETDELSTQKSESKNKRNKEKDSSLEEISAIKLESDFESDDESNEKKIEENQNKQIESKLIESSVLDEQQEASDIVDTKNEEKMNGDSKSDENENFPTHFDNNNNNAEEDNLKSLDENNRNDVQQENHETTTNDHDSKFTKEELAALKLKKLGITKNNWIQNNQTPAKSEPPVDKFGTIRQNIRKGNTLSLKERFESFKNQKI